MELKIIKNTKDLVLVGVSFENRMDEVSHVGFTGREEFVKVTKGKNHVMTIYYRDGKDCSFNFGSGGTTLISENMQSIKKQIINFIQKQNINYEIQEESLITEVELTPSGRYGICCHANGNFFSFFRNKQEALDFFDGKLVFKRTEIAKTGIDVEHYAMSVKGLNKE